MFGTLLSEKSFKLLNPPGLSNIRLLYIFNNNYSWVLYLTYRYNYNKLEFESVFGQVLINQSFYAFFCKKVTYKVWIMFLEVLI